MTGQLDDLDQAVTGESREAQSRVHHLLQVAVVELVAMAMALADHVRAVHGVRQRAVRDPHLLCTEPHRAAEIGLLVARLDRALLVLPFADQRDHGVRAAAVELRAVRPGETGHVARVLDDGELHPQADPEIGDAVDARMTHGLDLALDAALAEPARDQDRVHTIELTAAMPLQVLRLDETEVDARPRAQARVHQGLAERHVGITEVDVLADHRDGHREVRVALGRYHLLPFAKIRWRHVQPQLLADDVVESLLAEQHRDPVDVVGIDCREHGALLDVGEERDLAALLRRQGVAAAAQQHVGLYADRTQLLDRVLRGLGLDLARRRDVRDQRQMHIQDVVAPELDAELADRLEERQRLDVADRAADLDHAHVGVAGTHAYAVLDLVGDVRDHLHRGAQVITAALLGDHALIDPARREVAVAGAGRAHEPLVVPEVEVRLGTVVCYEHLAMLKGTHRAGIDVDVRVELDERDLEAAGLEDRTQRRGGNSLAQRGHHSAGHADKLGHWEAPPQDTYDGTTV